jgi:putative endonuclease
MPSATHATHLTGCDADRSRRERQARYWRGHWAEAFANLALWLRGYRVLARRKKTYAGEIDLIAVRGDTIVFAEVKRRASLDLARAALKPRQAQRMRNAADQWIKDSPRYRNHHRRFDAILVVPGRWPVHLPGCA